MVSRYISVFTWAVLRKRYSAATLLAVQVLFALAILWGLPMLIGDMQIDAKSALFGVWHLGVIAIGLTLAPQLVAEAKGEGCFTFLKNFPLSRLGIFLMEVLSWVAVSLPGILVTPILGALKYGSNYLSSTYARLDVILLLEICYLCIGVALALCFRIEIVQVLSQLLMLFAMLFTPILFPESNLPHALRYIHLILPFNSGQTLLVEPHFDINSISRIALILVWLITCVLFGTINLTRRK